MPRVIWKGAVSFGLVHIPVSLMPATITRGIDFDWLDKRSMEPVGYKRINKVTGEDITSENIVRGVKFEKNRYVVLSDEEIRAAYPESTQTVDIIAFVRAEQIPLLYIDTPYFLAPEKRGEKAYALLRQALVKSGRLALANVVLHNKQHLAVVVPFGDALLLDTLRWGDEVRGLDELQLNDEVVHAKLAQREIEMAERLIEDMSEDWDPAHYEDHFTKQIMDLVERKAQQGKLADVDLLGPASADGGAEIISLADLLKRSLGKKPGEAKAGAKPVEPKKSAATASRRPKRGKAGG